MKEIEISAPIIKYIDGKGYDDVAEITVEESLEIFLNGSSFYHTMYLPGDETALALGHCFTERIIESRNDVLLVRCCMDDAGNRVELETDSERKSSIEVSEERHLPIYSSREIPERDTAEDLKKKIPGLAICATLEVSRIYYLYEELASRQKLFKRTGGTHGAAIFSKDLKLLSFAEDVGRHNALDKSIGFLVAEDMIYETAIVVLTSRLSYEMVQKAGRLNPEIIIGTSAPTSLAVAAAKAANVTLIGFSRDNKGNIYSCPERIIFE